MGKTTIEWTDRTWNPVTGCTKVSPGCDHCYAETLAERFRGTPGHYFENGFDVQLRPAKLAEPLRWRTPSRVFVNSMSDLFHDDIPNEYIARVFAVMALTPQHTFQVLTKRHARMKSLLSSESFEAAVFDACDGAFDGYFQLPLPNVWLGVSAENQKWADIRIDRLLDTPAAVRFVSAEPLLGEIDIFRSTRIDRLPGLDWVIAGGESGRRARPLHPGWVRLLRDECKDAQIAFHFKQWGEWAPVDGQPQDGDVWVLGEAFESHAYPWRPDTEPAAPGRYSRYADHLMRRVGKKTAGRELDGRTWDEFPAGAS
ncbi:phage Gp37/Gp68 family protein [Rhodococcus sp. B10]|uniref:DUF5131 family protein n=1 Tax=Rhodococcus sp. B10 TaxID=2695876 RepID=UPI00142F83B1|nr:phage Gp37/Gp68 family protein [Rhodococcus sp. B10]NIL77654.1 hypothetical protein [Rhodococcus sp. B10]